MISFNICHLMCNKNVFTFRITIPRPGINLRSDLPGHGYLHNRAHTYDLDTSTSVLNGGTKSGNPSTNSSYPETAPGYPARNGYSNPYGPFTKKSTSEWGSEHQPGSRTETVTYCLRYMCFAIKTLFNFREIISSFQKFKFVRVSCW